MNIHLISKVACQLAISAAIVTPALSNIAAPMTERSVALHNEVVRVSIAGDMAEVSGIFRFTVSRSWIDESEYELYLPVYAAAGADLKKIQPTITRDGKTLAVTHAATPPFEKISTVSGQQAYWFKAKVAANDFKPDTSKLLTVEINYKQPLSDGAFIYTPLIPKQRKGKDYGSISFQADRGFKLQDGKNHDFVTKEGLTTVEPHHTRSIVIQLEDVLP